MSPQGLPGHQFGDTTHTKVFVGGLAWETQRETMRRYFDQFGEILEAVVITDKNTGRSKGYGFVTFREPEAARLSCVDAAPVIDGRRANCNLASLGVQRSRPTTPQNVAAGRNLRAMKTSSSSFRGIHGGGVGAAGFASPATTFLHYAFHQGAAVPYGVYGYSPYSPDYSYPTSFYNVYGGAQYPTYGGGASGLLTGTTAPSNAFYPYFQFDQGGGTGAAYAQGQSYGHGLQSYPAGMFSPYSTMNTTTAGVTGFAPQHYAGPMSLAPTPTPPLPGMMMAAPAPPTPPALGLIPAHFSPASKQSLA